jgi:hypothetical protein
VVVIQPPVILGRSDHLEDGAGQEGRVGEVGAANHRPGPLAERHRSGTCPWPRASPVAAGRPADPPGPQRPTGRSSAGLARVRSKFQRCAE